MRRGPIWFVRSSRCAITSLFVSTPARRSRRSEVAGAATRDATTTKTGKNGGIGASRISERALQPITTARSAGGLRTTRLCPRRTGKNFHELRRWRASHTVGSSSNGENARAEASVLRDGFSVPLVRGLGSVVRRGTRKVARRRRGRGSSRTEDSSSRRGTAVPLPVEDVFRRRSPRRVRGMPSRRPRARCGIRRAARRHDGVWEAGAAVRHAGQDVRDRVGCVAHDLDDADPFIAAPLIILPHRVRGQVQRDDRSLEVVRNRDESEVRQDLIVARVVAGAESSSAYVTSPPPPRT